MRPVGFFALRLNSLYGAAEKTGFISGFMITERVRYCCMESRAAPFFTSNHLDIERRRANLSTRQSRKDFPLQQVFLSLKESLETVPIVLLRRIWLEAAGILVILVVGTAMESKQEGQGFFRLTIFCAIGLGIHLSYSLGYMLKRQYSMTEGEIVEIKSRKMGRKWVEIEIRTENGNGEKMLVPAGYGIMKGKQYRFYSRNRIFIGMEEVN